MCNKYYLRHELCKYYIMIMLIRYGSKTILPDKIWYSFYVPHQAETFEWLWRWRSISIRNKETSMIPLIVTYCVQITYQKWLKIYFCESPPDVLRRMCTNTCDVHIQYLISFHCTSPFRVIFLCSDHFVPYNVNAIWTVVQLRFIQSTTSGCISSYPCKRRNYDTFSVIYDCILIYNISINGKR
jgi:hypothetical protein